MSEKSVKNGTKVYTALIIAVVLIVAIALAGVFLSTHRSGEDRTSQGTASKLASPAAMRQVERGNSPVWKLPRK